MESPTKWHLAIQQCWSSLLLKWSSFCRYNVWVWNRKCNDCNRQGMKQVWLDFEHGFKKLLCFDIKCCISNWFLSYLTGRIKRFLSMKTVRENAAVKICNRVEQLILTALRRRLKWVDKCTTFVLIALINKMLACNADQQLLYEVNV